MLVIIMVFQLCPLEVFATSSLGMQQNIYDTITDKSEDAKSSQPQANEPAITDVDEELRGISKEDMTIKPEEFTGEDVVYELENKREQNAKHFRMSDGSNIVVSYQSDIHFEGENGQYQEIDNSLSYRNSDGSDFNMEELKSITDILKQEAKEVSKVEDSFDMEPSTDKKEIIMPTETTDPTSAIEDIGDISLPHHTDDIATEDDTVDIEEKLDTDVELQNKADTQSLENIEEKQTANISEENHLANPETEFNYPTSEKEDVLFEQIKQAKETLKSKSIENTASDTKVKFAAMTGEQPIISMSLDEFAIEMSPIQTTDKKDLDGILANIEEATIASLGTYAVSEKNKKHTNDALAAQKLSLDEAVRPQNNVSAIVYEDVFPSTDLRYTLSGNNVKEDIVVKERLDQYVYSFTLNLKNLEPKQTDDGSIGLYDKAGKQIYIIPAPYMVDAGDAYSEDAKYTLESSGDGSHILTVTADKGWMNDRSRQYPVIIDPPIYLHDFIEYNTNKVETSYVYQGSPSSVNWNVSRLYAGNSSSGSYWTLFRMLELPVIPSNSVIVNAQVSFFNRRGSSSGLGNGLKVLAKALESNPSMSIRDKSWNNTTSLLSDKVLDYNTIISTSDEYHRWNITREAIKWYDNPSTNYGIAFVPADNTLAYAGLGGRRSGNVNGSDTSPLFILNYRDTVGLEDYYTYQAYSAGRAGTAYLSDLTTQITHIKKDISYDSTVNPFTLQHIYNASVADKQVNYYIDNSQAKDRFYNNMLIGQGWRLSCQETIRIVTLEDNPQENVIYTDGDGTEHHFLKNGSYYYDEDGLGMYVNANGSTYTMYDRAGNTKYFYNGVLTYIKDKNNNYINFLYNTSSSSDSGTSWYPNSSNTNQLRFITRKNNGQSSEVLATLSYSGNNLYSIADSVGNYTYFYYTNNKLTSIKHADGKTVTYEYANVSTKENHKMKSAKDDESGKKLTISYNSSIGKVNGVYEYSGTSMGAFIGVNGSFAGKALYRWCGADRAFSGASNDDIITTSLFDYYGRTVNTYSTDQNGIFVLGAEATRYKNNTATGADNNKLRLAGAIGTASVNFAVNGGFERGANEWSSLAQADSSKKHTGKSSLKISNTSMATKSIYQSYTLKANTTYILSAYVNTQEATFGSGGSVYLALGNTSGEPLNWDTSTSGNNGWYRISACYTPTTSSLVRLNIHTKNMSGNVYVDDVQLEAVPESSYSAGAVNLLENGGFDQWGVWQFVNAPEVEYDAEVKFSGSRSVRMQGTPNTTPYALQTVQLDQPSSQTYFLSGWAKADSVSNADAAYDRFFGILAQLVYSDGTAEDHVLAFNTDITDWQYGSLPIVPKKENKTVSRIDIYIRYYRNCNTAYFDNISLVAAPAQEYSYNDKGELTAIKSDGGNSNYQYNANGDVNKEITAGNGTIDYTYTTSGRNLYTTTNDGIRTTMTYDTSGNPTSSTLRKSDNSGMFIKTNFTYTNNNNQIATMTDSRGKTTTYNYSTNWYRQTGQPSSIQDAKGTIVEHQISSTNFRPSISYISSNIGVRYDYNSYGQLTTLNRDGFNAPGATKKDTQTYGYGYDTYGNLSSVKVGMYTLRSNTYAPNNGLLSQSKFGNNQYANYSYDKLERITKKSYNNGGYFDYKYSGDGQLASIYDSQNGVTKYVNYDKLGRLAGYIDKNSSGIRQNGRYIYDTASRITRLTYGAEGYSDRNYGYTYNNANGLLTQVIVPGGDTLTNNYTDDLHRLIRKSIYLKYDKNYSYVAGSGSSATTSLISNLNYNWNGIKWQASYAYDDVGNITKQTGGTGSHTIDYAYDPVQSQLTKEVLSGSMSRTYEYSYDTYGNIRKKFMNGSEVGSYTYGNTSWNDLLTAYNGKSISYDGAGNPTSYNNGSSYTMSWKRGRELSTVIKGGETSNYTYDADGMRIVKVSGGVTSNFYYQGTSLVAETRGTNKLEFIYDDQNTPLELIYNGTKYYYITNLQGDVVKIFNSSGGEVANYVYNAYGEIISSSGTMASVNPLRYRGYYYDNETGFYYLASRYYDPVICRFINADTADTIMGGNDNLLGYNLFTYCFNNPVNMTDENGEWPEWAKKVAIGVAVIAACAVITVATGGAGAGVAGYIAAGALNCSVVSAVSGAAIGAGTSAVSHRISTGSWKGAGQAALDGGASGFMAGAISGAITGAAGRTMQVLRNVKGTGNLGKTGNPMSSQSIVKNGEVTKMRFYNANGKATFQLDFTNANPKYHSAIHGHKINFSAATQAKRWSEPINNLWKSRW